MYRCNLCNSQVEFENGDVMFCNFTRGVIHGLTKTFNSDKKMVHMSWYQNGTPHGTSWQWCKGGGYLVGCLDVNGNFSGRNLSFLYPDLSTALTGETTFLINISDNVFQELLSEEE